jgi:hypothetical protein
MDYSLCQCSGSISARLAEDLGSNPGLGASRCSFCSEILRRSAGQNGDGCIQAFRNNFLIAWVSPTI